MSTAAPEPRENMGKPEPRIDGRLKVTGEALYGSDFPVANSAYAFLVTSAITRGRIEAMDLGAAKAVAGVLEILALQLPFPQVSESMGNHDSNVVGAGRVC
jgi:xanthine dehydrogenase YagR molybdenum-binding subunit